MGRAYSYDLRHPLHQADRLPNWSSKSGMRNVANIVQDQSHRGDVMGIGVNRKMKFPPAAA